MNNWAEGIGSAIRYIEDNLAGELDIADIAAQAYVSAFHFQRIFSVLCGMTVGEYIRARRLTLAAQELSRGDIRVIDAAVKYGYDSPDSFARAFTRFHGITPSAAKEKGAALKSYAPLKIRLTLEGGSMMDYRIVEKAQFTVMGVSRKFSSETSYQEIPKFWRSISGTAAEKRSRECSACASTPRTTAALWSSTTSSRTCTTPARRSPGAALPG